MQNVAQTILEQLGGNRFIAMTGAKNLVGLSMPRQGLQFKIGRGAKSGITNVVVTLAENDLYNVEFWKIRGVDMKLIHQESNVYAEGLAAHFANVTGFDTKF